MVTGNPVRSEFRPGTASAARGRAFLGLEHGERLLLVLGGSQGASEINELVRASLPELTRHYTVIHQTGRKDWDLPASERYRPYAYINDDMSGVLAAAELVLGRAGAGTVWESASLGKPMVLIPLMGSGTRGDQVENACFFENAGAAQALLGEDASPEKTARAVNALAEDEAMRSRMASASLKAGAVDGAALIADAIARSLGENAPGSRRRPEAAFQGRGFPAGRQP
jgi:UDP-N-acetylglucosamine--N-acetylmuramyl-(pentapeptide) pyrophosphoryl-undecaprenol N-acetylglucosamine transferase